MSTVKLKDATETIKNLNAAATTLSSSTHVAGHSDGLYALINNLISDLSSIKASIKAEEKIISASINSDVAANSTVSDTTLAAGSHVAATLRCSLGRGDDIDTSRYTSTGTTNVYPGVLKVGSVHYSENAVYAVLAEAAETINELRYGTLTAGTTESQRHTDTKVTLAA